MKGQLRKSGIDIIGDVPWGTHFCQFYQTKEDLIDILVPYFKEGLENNEFCMWVTSQPLDAEEAKEALRKAVLDIDAYLERGQIEIIPYANWYVNESVFDSRKVLNGWIEKLNNVLASGYDGLRLSGNTFWVDKRDWDDFVDYEEEVDRVLGSYRMIALCTYSLNRCDSTEIIDVTVNHQFALIKKKGEWQKIESSRSKKAEKIAVQATKHWEYTFDAIPDLIAILDDQYRIIRANKAMASRLNVRPEECAGSVCYKAVHGTEEPPSFCPNRQLLKDGNEHTSEVYEDCFGGYFLVSVSPLHSSDGKLIGSVHVARDINERKQAEDALRQSEQHARLKLEKILSPVGGTDTFELAEIVDIPVIQSLINDFYTLTNIPVSLNDLKCNFLACVGWQEICTKFHRAHPETCRHCVESDIELSTGISPEEFKLYRCRNNMWDITTPIMVAGQQVGSIFSGQFFFEDEILDYELFRSQARKYGFNEEEYISALEKVPRLSRETVDAGMAFLMGFANILSQLSYSNINLAQSLVERDTLVYALRESDERFRSVLDNSLDSAYRMDFHNNCFDYMSPVIEQITGFSVKEIDAMANGLIDRIHPDDHQLVMVGGAQSLDKGFGAHEYRFKCKDGKYCWLADHFSIIKDKTGMTRYRAGIVRDITEKKQAEEALIRSESKFRTLAENSPDIILRFDRQHRHIYVNPATAEPYGCPPEEIIGKTHSELGLCTDPEKIKLWENHHEKVFATGKPETMEFEYTSPEGKEYYFNTQIVPEFVNGKVVSVLAISHDITDIKEAESRLKNTLDNLENLVKERTVELEKAYTLLKEREESLAESQKMAHIGNWEWDIEADKAYWSEEMYRIFGLDPKKAAPSYDEYLRYIHPDDRNYYDSFKKAATGGPFGIDYRIVLANGEERTVHLTSELILSNKNTPVRIKGVVQDITERKKAEKALVNLEIARKKEIHHRIKNNLQVISSLLDLQAEKFRGRKYIENSEVLNAFRESQDRVISIALIHEELHEGGRTNTLNFSPYLQRLVESLFQTYTLGNADISLNIDLEEDTFFDMDTAIPLGLIVNELVSNALKHAFPARSNGEIQIKLYRELYGECNKGAEDKNGDNTDTSFTLIVSDNGVGIPEDLDLENPETLGIQLITTLVDQLNGELKINKDYGTEFCIKFAIEEK